MSSGDILCAHPAVKTAERMALIMHRFGVELGLTPTSRTRIQVANPDQGDLFERSLFEDSDAESLNGERVQ